MFPKETLTLTPQSCRSLGSEQQSQDEGLNSSGGPRPANKLLHTYPPPYIFFHLPSSTLIRFHHFSTFLSVHLIRFFIIIFQNFLQSFSPFSSPHSFHQLPSKMSFPQSPHLIHFNFFLQNILQKIFVIKKYSICLKTICPFPGQEIEQQQHHSPPSFHHFYHIFVWGVARLVGFYWVLWCGVSTVGAAHLPRLHLLPHSRGGAEVKGWGHKAVIETVRHQPCLNRF